MPLTPPSTRYLPSTRQYFRVVIRVRHAEPVFEPARLGAQIATRVRMIDTQPRATLVAGSGHAWRSARTDEAWDSTLGTGEQLVEVSGGISLGVVAGAWAGPPGMVIGGLAGALAGLVSANVAEHDPVSPQWWMGLEGTVLVGQGGISHEELCRAIARAVADVVSWRGQLDATATWDRLPTHGGDLLTRLLAGSADPHGIYARAVIAVAEAAAPVDDRQPQVRQPPAGTVSRTTALEIAVPTLVAIVGIALVVAWRGD